MEFYDNKETKNYSYDKDRDRDRDCKKNLTRTGIVKRKFDRDQDWTKKCDFADPYPKYC
jgi:hypothetical protein